MARAIGCRWRAAAVHVLLAQGGEFGFVVFQAAAGAGVIDAPTSSLLVAAVAISMLLTPLVLVAADRLAARYARSADRKLAEIDEPQNAPVIIAGFGRYGQIVGRLLLANGIQPTVLDHDGEQIEAVRRFGWRAFYGDATRLDLLRVAGAGRARVLVVAIDDVAQSLAVVDLAREHFPQLTHRGPRTQRAHWYQLRARRHADRARDVRLRADERAQRARGAGLRAPPGAQPGAALSPPQRRAVRAMAPHFRDEKLIALSKIGRQQLEAQWARNACNGNSAGDWQSPVGDEPPPHGRTERSYTVGTVPPSMTCSVPLIGPARGETRKATRSATSRGFAGRPSGMPPSEFMMICLPPS